MAETEKYAHVTYFFNGGREQPWEGEERHLVDSPRRRAHLRPQAPDERCRRGRRVRRPPGRGRLPLRDHQSRQPRHGRPHGRHPRRGGGGRGGRSRFARVVAAVHEGGGACIVTADHGNAEQMLEPDGSPNTAYSTNPVPAIVTVRGAGLRDGGILADVAPTVSLEELLEIQQPEAMTGTGRLLSRSQRAPRFRQAGLRDRDSRRPAQACFRTGHGEIYTPAFIPLATKATVRSLSSAEVAGLGYELVLGNTFHLHLAPGRGSDRRPRRPARLHGLGARGNHRLRRVPGLLVAHGGVADEIKGRRGRRPAAPSRDLRARCRFQLLADGSDRFIGPEESMAIQAKLGSDIALAFDECTPYHADRDYTARLLVHPPLAGALPGLARARGP